VIKGFFTVLRSRLRAEGKDPRLTDQLPGFEAYIEEDDSVYYRPEPPSFGFIDGE
jgi:hypothetical protein